MKDEPLEGEPLHPDAAKRLIIAILKDGVVSYTSHAFRELEKDRLTTVDAVNVLRGGVVEPAEFENGEWRYRVCTRQMYVVASFISQARLRVVTAWRVKR